MASSTPKSGYDAWTLESAPHAPHPSSATIQLRSFTGGDRHGWLWLPFPSRLAGRAVGSAPLTGHAHGPVNAQTLTFRAAAARWEAGKVTFHNEPGVVGPTVTVTIPALADGQSFTVDLAALVQPVADGTRPNYGWRITTDASPPQKFESFDGPGLSWSLAIAYSEAPEIPSDPRPNGTTVGVPKPVVSTDFVDYEDGNIGGSVGWLQVQVDLNGDGTPDADTTQIPATAPTYDLSLLAFTAPTSGATVRWRMKVWDEDGNPSPDFCPWASYTYVPNAPLVLDSPAGGILFDPTTEVLAHITGPTALEAWRLWITDADDPTSVRYDSRKQPADDPSAIVAPIPLKNDDGSRVFTDDHDYTLRLRAFDDEDRESTPGVPPWSELVTTVHFDDDLALAAPTSYQVNQVDDTPFLRHTWTDVAAGDAYVISRDGVHIARLEPADVVSGVSAYSWVEQDSAPFVRHTYRLRRLTVGVGRSAPLSASVVVECPGVWLVRQNGDFACLLGDPPTSASSKDRRSIYKPPYVPHDVDVITAYEGLSDDGFDHWIEDHYPMPGGLTVAETKAVLSDIKRHPREAVQLVFGGFSKPVRLRNLSVDPHDNFVARTQAHRVTFGATQVGDFDYRIS